MNNREKLNNVLSNEMLAKMICECGETFPCEVCPAKRYCDSKRVYDPDESGDLVLPDGMTCEIVLIEWLSKDNKNKK